VNALTVLACERLSIIDYAHSTMSIIAIAAGGMNAATQVLERSADAIARSAAGGDEHIARSIVDTIEAKAQFRSSAALVRVSDEMLSDLLAIQRER
jgi:hypothetical protein